MRYAKLVFLLSVFTAFSANAHALIVLKGSEAESYLGDAKQHFVGKNYTFEILSRNHRDSMHGRFSDGVIFNAEGGNFLYPRRKNGDHIIVIDAPDGREEEPVTEDVWRQKIKNTLSDDNRMPYVFLDDSRKEIAVVYIGKGTQISSKTTPEGLLQIELVVDGARDSAKSSRFRR